MNILLALKICIGLAILAVLLAGVAGFVLSSRISREEEFKARKLSLTKRVDKEKIKVKIERCCYYKSEILRTPSLEDLIDQIGYENILNILPLNNGGMLEYTIIYKGCEQE